MRTIAIINQKGGCGKTTVSINLAAVLASMGRKTLLVDMDPQSHCSLGLAVPEDKLERSIGDMLRCGLDGTMAFGELVWQISRHLDLAPSTIGLAGIEQALSTAPDKDRRLQQILSTVADDYEYCVIDCPPSIGLLTFNALRAAEEVIIPVETGYFSLQGAIRQEKTIRSVARKVNHVARFKVLATMYDLRAKLARKILSELRQHFKEQLLPVVVHFSSKLKEASSFGLPITEYDADSRGMKDFERLADWLVSNPLATEPDEPMIRTHPTASRAAELVERARALSARTAALASNISGNGVQTTAAETGNRAVAAFVNTHANAKPAGAVLLDPPRKEAVAAAGEDQRVASLYGVKATARGILFIQPSDGASQMQIAGDFNAWTPSTTPMCHDEHLGIWQAHVELPPGRYQYRVVVDGNWIRDPHNSDFEINPFGELNSVVDKPEKH